MTDVHVFTSAAFNYIPKVRMLFNSLKELHPEWQLHLALADELRDNVDLSNEPFDHVWPAAKLGIPDWQGWSYCHTIVELATAIKPFMLQKLLKLPGAKKVIYLDPDTVAFSKLTDIVDALDEANILLTPHQTMPDTTVSAVMDNEISSLKHGIYNLGFFAVSATEVGHEFASWWGQRLYHFCRASIPNGLFTDQRWIDLVPAFFSGVAIMRSSRYNVATWNLTTREMSFSDTGGYLVDGEPLGFYHFTGFDSGDHRVMAHKNAGNNIAVHKLIDWYSDEIEALAKDPLAEEPWAYGCYSNGELISKEQRVIYRERTDLQKAFPNPYEHTSYLSWWNTQAIEEYPELFNDDLKNDALDKINFVLTAGFTAGRNEVSWRKTINLFHSKGPKESVRRCWEIIKNEGIGELKKRLLN